MNDEIIKSPMDWDTTWMKEVYFWASKSKDVRTSVGCVLVKDNILVSSGYNGFPINVKDYYSRYENRQIKYLYVSHAECNSVCLAARHGKSTLGSVCFTTGIPCDSCSKCLIQAGIKEIVIHSLCPSFGPEWAEKQKISKIMLEEAGIPIRIFDKPVGMKLRFDGKIVDV